LTTSDKYIEYYLLKIIEVKREDHKEEVDILARKSILFRRAK